MSKRRSLANHFLNFLSVILGVYLAFYMNERASTHKENIERKEFIQSIITELSSDVEVYEAYQIPANTEHLQSIGRLVELLLKDSIEGIENELAFVFQVENFAPTSSTYNSVKSSGKLGLLHDLTMQKALSSYYEGQAIESVRKGEFQVSYFSDELLRWATRNMDILEMRIIKKDELIVFRNMLVMYESILDQKIRSYESLVEESKVLIESLESIL